MVGVLCYSKTKEKLFNRELFYEDYYFVFVPWKETAAYARSLLGLKYT